MNYHIDKIEQNPFALFVTCTAEDSKIVFFAHFHNLIGDGTGLAVACAGGDEEIIRRGTLAGKVEYNYVSAVSFESDFSRFKGEFFCG